MSICSCIVVYTLHPEKLAKVVAPLRNLGDVFIFSPDVNVSKFGTHIPTDIALGHHTVFAPRQFMADRIAEYDYFLYNESDILITESNIQAVIEHGKALPEGSVSGFLRYERRNLDKRLFIDLHPMHSCHTGGDCSSSIRECDTLGWTPWNVHSGNFLLSQKQLQSLIESNRWEIRYNQRGQHYAGVLETGATGIYRVLKKVLPYDFLSVSVEHLDVKYDGPTTEELYEKQNTMRAIGRSK